MVPGYRRRTRKLVLLLIVVAMLVVGDVAARRAVEAQLERRVQLAVASAEGVPADSVKVHIGSFPFLGRLAVTGNVSQVRASVGGVEVRGLRFESIGVDLNDVHLDRDRLARSRQVDITGIGRGRAVAQITQADLRRALDGVPVVLGPGRIGVTVAGVTASVSARVTDGVLRLSAAGVSLPTLTLPKLPLLPCVAQAVSEPGRLVLSCAVAQVPPELLRQGVPSRSVSS